MKRLLYSFALVLFCVTPACSGAPAPLTTLVSIRALSNAEAGQQLPVFFEATAIYFNRATRRLYVQEGDQAIFVRPPADIVLLSGDRVQVQGTTRPSFLPYVMASEIHFLRHESLPKPLPVSFDDMVRTNVNCRYVQVHGVVRTADIISIPTESPGRLELLMDGGYIDLDVDSSDIQALDSLLDSEVEVNGTAARIFDGKMQQTGVAVRASSIADIRVIKRAVSDPWAVPLTPLDQIITGTHERDLSQRLRVHGTITYYQPGSAVVLQNGDRTLWVSTQTSEPLQIGDIADATGFPYTHERSLTLSHAEVQDSNVLAPVPPMLATWHQLAYWGRSSKGGHQYDLVSIEGRVVNEAREATQDEYIVDSDGQMFTAIYRHPPAPRPVLPMLQVPLGSKVRMTGICLMLDSDPFNEEAPFNIMLRSFNDITVLANPPLLNIRNLIVVAVVLLLVVLVVGIRGWILERKVRRQTSALAARIEAEAALERRRSRILEDINGIRPLAEILEEILDMLAFQLKGAPCWCEIIEGAQLGTVPPQPRLFRIVQGEIPARSGASLGTVSAALSPLSPPNPEESEALFASARLAALAVETRRLYSDLLRRSEFDLLTDIHNRFSLEKHLDKQIEEARFKASVFGLIYIDLDGFKQINDQYGHHIGDLYLQEAALRMKRQLRPHDTLARLGGDEFAALIPTVRSRAEVEEIVLRLERCFDESFVIERLSLHGGASIGLALYPADGASRDSLLNAADVAMYSIKKAKKQLLAELAAK